MKQHTIFNKALTQCGFFREMVRNKKVLSSFNKQLLAGRLSTLIIELQIAAPLFHTEGVYKAHVAHLIVFYRHQLSLLNNIVNLS